MLTLKIIVGFWMAFTAVWMIAQDIRLERIEKRLMELEGDE